MKNDPLDFINSRWIIVTSSIKCSKCNMEKRQERPEDGLAHWLSLNGWILNNEDEPVCPKCNGRGAGVQ